MYKPLEPQQNLVKLSDMPNPEEVAAKNGDVPARSVPDESVPEPTMRTKFACFRRNYITIFVLCFINLINYMDRYTVAGVLTSVKGYYDLNDTEAGLIQTSFIISYMIMAPVFGYLGDRYNRKFIISCGVFFWSATTLCGSFVSKQYFPVFLFLRALVGVGEASYSTIAPTIIADLFTHGMRTKMLAIFYFAIPVGSGLGYIVGSQVAEAFGNWQWALRVTPPLGALAVVLTATVVVEPPRGQSEGGAHLENTRLVDDMRDLLKNRSFILSTLGFTCVAFATGALAWWAPTYVERAIKVSGETPNTYEIGLKFGIITCIAGITGVIVGTAGAHYYRRYNPRADPLICAIGILCSVPMLFIGCTVAHVYLDMAWAFIFFGEVFLCMNWAIVADILLYVVIPTRRSMAEAVQILASHALGDAFSPYMIGTMSDAIKRGKPSTAILEYTSLQYSLYITGFVLVIGGVCFLATAMYIVQDKEKCKRITLAGGEEVLERQQSLPNPVRSSDEDLAWSFSDTHQLIV